MTAHASVRPTVTALAVALALALGGCAVEQDPGSWSPPSTAAPTDDHGSSTGGEGEDDHGQDDHGDGAESTATFPGGAEPAEPMPAQDGLEGETWVLGVGFFDGQDDNGERGPATLRFEGGQVEVVTGCNTGGGSYEIDGSRLSLGAISSTMMACEGTVATVERLVFGLLSQKELRATITDGEYLTLTAADGTALGFLHSAIATTGDPSATQAPGDDGTATVSPPAPTGPGTTTETVPPPGAPPADDEPTTEVPTSTTAP